MPVSATHPTTERISTTLAALGALAMVLFLVTPRAAPGTLALLALATGLAGGFAGGLGASTRAILQAAPPVPFALMLALGVWSVLSVTWSGDRAESFSKGIMLVAIVATTGWAQLALKETRPDLLRHAGRAALVAFAAALVFLCIEEATDHALKRLMFLLLPFTRPDGKHLGDTDYAFLVASYFSNRSMAAVSLAIWPMLLLARGLVDPARRLPAMAAVLVLAALTMALSKHETSVIALMAAATVLVVCLAWPKLGLCLVAAGWVVATLLVVPLASWASHGAQLHSATWLPNSARHRIVLWAYTAEQVQSRPLLGVGAAATKKLDTARGASVDPLPGTRYQWRSGPHAHNVYLQTWYELGAVGAALLCAAGLAMVAVLSRLPATALPFAAAAMTAAAVTGSFSWGLWQAWFLAAFGVSAVLTALAVQVVRQGEAE